MGHCPGAAAVVAVVDADDEADVEESARVGAIDLPDAVSPLSPASRVVARVDSSAASLIIPDPVEVMDSKFWAKKSPASPCSVPSVVWTRKAVFICLARIFVIFVWCEMREMRERRERCEMRDAKQTHTQKNTHTQKDIPS